MERTFEKYTKCPQCGEQKYRITTDGRYNYYEGCDNCTYNNKMKNVPFERK